MRYMDRYSQLVSLPSEGLLGYEDISRIHPLNQQEKKVMPSKIKLKGLVEKEGKTIRVFAGKQNVWSNDVREAL